MKNLFVLVAGVLSMHVSAQVFSTPVVMESMNGSGGGGGEYNSHLVVNGNPAIAYYDIVHGNLMYTRALDASGISWGTPVIADDVNDVGKFCSMNIVQGFPAIAYFDETYDRLMYVRALDSDGNSWGTPVVVEDIPNQYPAYSTLEIVNGNPAIGYAEIWTSYHVKFVRASDNTGATWNSSQTIASSGILGADTRLFIVNGNPAVVYNNQSDGAIYYQRSTDADGTVWPAGIPISGVGDQGYEMSCAFANGNPAISYVDATTSTLKFVAANDADGASWQIPVTLDNSPNVGRHTSMIHSGTYLMIAYYDGTNDRAKFIRSLDATATTWNTPVPCTANGDGGWENSIQIVNGFPAISCTNQSTDTLRFVRASDASGNAWGTVQLFPHPHSSGTRMSMAVVNGKPAVASANRNNSKLVYCIATDGSGQTWNQSIEISTTQPGGGYTSLNVVDNRPAIAFSGNGSNRLRYIRALDTEGNVWANPTRVDSLSSVQQCKLITLNGIPTILYYAGGQLHFTRATDTSGTSWIPAINPLGSGTATSDFDIDVVDGRPAIVFGNPATSSFAFVIANDSLGAGWNTPVSIGPVGNNFAGPSLEVVNGMPAVVVEDATSQTVNFYRSLDSLGSSWGAPVVTSPSTTNCYNPILIVHDGRPVISFAGGFFERYSIWALDGNGSAWATEVFVDSVYASPALCYSGITSVNGWVGIGYEKYNENYGYFSSACIPPLPPTASNTSLCLGMYDTLSVSGYGSISWYSSSSGGTYLGSGNSFTTPVLTNTTTYYVQDSTCAASTRTAVTVTVNQLPTISLSGNTSFCIGDSTTLNVAGNGDGFEWSTGSIAIAENFAPTVTTPYWVTTYDGSGCVDTLFFTINVQQPQTVTQSIAICDGDVFTVGNSSYTTAGTYTDSLSSALGCDSTVITTLTVQTVIDTTVSYSAGVLSSNEVGASYQWINCQNGQPIAGATMSTFTPTQNGTYGVAIVSGPCSDTTVCYTVTDVGIAEQSPSQNLIAAYDASTNEIVLHLTGVNGLVHYKLYNALGELIADVTSTGEVRQTTGAKGLYLVVAEINGDMSVQRVLVR